MFLIQSLSISDILKITISIYNIHISIKNINKNNLGL